MCEVTPQSGPTSPDLTRPAGSTKKRQNGAPARARESQPLGVRAGCDGRACCGDRAINFGALARRGTA